MTMMTMVTMMTSQILDSPQCITLLHKLKKVYNKLRRTTFAFSRILVEAVPHTTPRPKSHFEATKKKLDISSSFAFF
jgi:hypothetical protein